MAQFFMSRARKLFQYVDLQGSTVTSPTSEGRVTSSMTSSNGDATVRIDDVSSSLTSHGDSVDKMLRQRRRKRNFMILAGVCSIAIITIIGLTYHDNASKIIASIPSAFSSASQGRTGEKCSTTFLIWGILFTDQFAGTTQGSFINDVMQVGWRGLELLWY